MNVERVVQQIASGHEQLVAHLGIARPLRLDGQPVRRGVQLPG